MDLHSRRDILGGFGRAALLAGLTGAAWRTGAFAAPVRPNVETWLTSLRTAAGDLRRTSFTPDQWRAHVSGLLADVPMPDLLVGMDFERLRAGMVLPSKGVNTEDLFPGVESAPEEKVIFRMFGMDAGRAIIPHGHDNMVSAHMVLGGEFRLRMYDRVGDETDALLVRPSEDRMIGAGDYSAISDADSNVHWFVADGGPAYTFDVIVSRIDANAGTGYDIHNLDADAADAVGDGVLRMPKLGVDAALAKYG